MKKVKASILLYLRTGIKQNNKSDLIQKNKNEIQQNTTCH